MEYQITAEELDEILHYQDDYWNHIDPPLHETDIETIIVSFFEDGELDTITIYRKNEIYKTSQEYQSHATEYTIERNPSIDLPNYEDYINDFHGGRP